MKILTKTIETWNVDNMAEADILEQEMRADPTFEIKKFSKELKQIKEKKEIVGEYVVVNLTKEFFIED